MKRVIVALTVLILLLSSIPLIANIAYGNAVNCVVLPDAELATQFAYGWGNGSPDVISDIAGIGVQFNFTGLDGSGTAIRDDYAVSQLAGGDPDIASGYGNFSRFTHYGLVFDNIGTNNVTVNVFMNTGFTGGSLGRDGTYDTYWECNWVFIDAGETRAVTLDFSQAIAYGAGDDPNASWRYTDGTVHPIHRLDEVTNIGFQVIGNGNGNLTIWGAETRVYIDPGSVDKQYADVGGTFDVTIKVDNVSDLYGFDFNITWDNTLITYNSDTYSAFLNTIWPSSYTVLQRTSGVSGNTGWFKYSASALAPQKGFSSTGSQGLITLTFNIIDPQTNSMRETLLHFVTDKMSNSQSAVIIHTTEEGAYSIWGEKPTLDLNPTTKTCRIYGNESFGMTIDVTDASNVEGLEFEIHFNTTLLNYTSVSWDAFGGGSTNVDESNGIVTGSTSGSPVSGVQTLITITFNASLARIWKNLAGWQNDQNGTIFIQEANLTYATPQPKLQYERGGADQINVGADVVYTFSPIKGDVNNDGTVDVYDLSDVTYYYDDYNTTYDLVDPLGDPGYIDIFDVVIVTSNFGYTYTP